MHLSDNNLFGVLADTRRRVRLGMSSAKAAGRLDVEIEKIRRLIAACAQGKIDASGQLIFSVADTKLFQEALSACVVTNNAPASVDEKLILGESSEEATVYPGPPNLRRTAVSNVPAFISFTGVDENTDKDQLVALARDYPVEFGLLFSPSQQGFNPRYPRISRMIAYLRDLPDVSWAAHMCGKDAYTLYTSGRSQHKWIMSFFRRMQVNGEIPSGGQFNILDFAQRHKVRPIMQCRGSFTSYPAFDLLHDCSAGTGKFTDEWPVPLVSNLCGYAGGISPDNVSQVVARIQEKTNGQNRYWLDMESGVRNSLDHFDLDKCRKVCEAVYGRPMMNTNHIPLFS